MRHTQVQPALRFREPAARHYAVADQIGRVALEIFLPILAGNEQRHRRREVEVNRVGALRATANRAFDEAESRVLRGEPLSRRRRVNRLAPNAAPRAAYLVFGGQQNRELSYVRRDRHCPGQPLAQQDFPGIATVRKINMRQQPAVMVLAFALEGEHHALAPHPLRQPIACPGALMPMGRSWWRVRGITGTPSSTCLTSAGSVVARTVAAVNSVENKKA